MEASVDLLTTLVYQVDGEDVIVSVDAPWDVFAQRNGAQILTGGFVLGRSIFDFVADPTTRHLYGALLARVREHGVDARFPFRCDAPGLRRFMHMEIASLPYGGVEFRSRTVRTEPRPAVALLDDRSPRSTARITMCGWCKRVDHEGAWVEVERYLEESMIMKDEPLPLVSHGMCGTCEKNMMLLLDAET